MQLNSIIEKDTRFTVRQMAQVTIFGLATLHFILNKNL